MSSPESKHYQKKWSFEDEESKKEENKKDSSKKKSKCKKRERSRKSSRKNGRSPLPVREMSSTNIPELPPGCSTNAATPCNHANAMEEKNCYKNKEAVSPRLLRLMRQRSSSSGRKPSRPPAAPHGRFGNRQTPVVSPAPAKSTPVTPVQTKHEAAVMEIDELIRGHCGGKRDIDGQPIDLDWYLNKKGLKAEKNVKEAAPKMAPAKDSEKQPAADIKNHIQLPLNSMLVGNGFTIRIQQPAEPGGVAVLHLNAMVEGINGQPVVQQAQQAASKPNGQSQAQADPKDNKASEHKPN
ncbi:hypothetical protein M3Y94_00968800 [Aphelenchoides besseyi]|nr:hypothetical protein M3Y94_00968800 [Aphelenchoides besseyi]KAI6224639.1 hypothetical protein M3Y95_00774100 [Aphelenchoides besseyi]